MTHQLTVALLGHGAIAKYVVDQLQSQPGLKIMAVICREASHARALQFSNGKFEVNTSVNDLSAKPDLIVDCAGHSGLLAHAANALRRGIDVVSISTGALAAPGVIEELDKSANAGNSSIRFLSGAVAGIDALVAANIGDLDQVVYTGRKPPAGWIGSAAEEVCDLANLNEPFEHFSGTARTAAQQYPKNANVAATIALASLGLDKVNVKLIADPGIERNIHELSASGSFGSLSMRIEGKPLPDNPGSSALAAMSLVAELERLQRKIVI